MMCRRAAYLSILASELALSAVGTARADVCAGSKVAVDAALARRWPELQARAQRVLEQQRDVDRCADVRLAWRAEAIQVVVQLADGRATERDVNQEGDVVPTLAALLVLPQPIDDAPASANEAAPLNAATTRAAAPAPAAPVENTPSVVVGVQAVAPRRDTLRAPESAATSRARALRIELSALTGARIGDGQASFGVGALSLLELSGWLVGFAGRADRYHATGPGDSSSSALELALLGGRRWRSGNTAFDLLAGPAAALQGTTTFSMQAPMSQPITESSSSTAPRFILGVRADFFEQRTLRPFVSLDGEIGPARAAPTSLPDAPRLPLWTIGLSTGLTVGT